MRQSGRPKPSSSDSAPKTSLKAEGIGIPATYADQSNVTPEHYAQKLAQQSQMKSIRCYPLTQAVEALQ